MPAAPGQIRAGQDHHGGEWAGDYSGTSLDPIDTLTVWTIQPYAETDIFQFGYEWGTWIGVVALHAPPP